MRRLALIIALTALTTSAQSPCYRTPSALVQGVRASGYEKLDRPSVAKAGSLDAPFDNVSVFFEMQFLLAVEQRVQRLDFQGQFDVKWRDERLAFDAACAGAETMSFPKVVTADWWLPQPFVLNEISTDWEGTNDVGFVLSADGSVEWSGRRRILTKCKMDFKNMPYDTQRCPIKFGVNTQGVNLIPEQLPETVPKGNPEWNLKSIGRSMYKENELVQLTIKLKRRSQYWRKYIVIPVVLFVLVSYSSFYVARTAAPARVGGTVVCFLVMMNFLTATLNTLPRVDYDVRLLTFLYLSMWFCGFSIFEYAIVNMLLRVETRVEKARTMAEAEYGITKIDEKREIQQRIKMKAKAAAQFARSVRGRKSPRGSPAAPRKEPSPSDVEAAQVAESNSKLADDKVQEKIEAEVRRAAGKFGRLFLYGADMWIKDQHLDIVCRWFYLPLYVVLSSLSLNFSSD